MPQNKTKSNVEICTYFLHLHLFMHKYTNVIATINTLNKERILLNLEKLSMESTQEPAEEIDRLEQQCDAYFAMRKKFCIQASFVLVVGTQVVWIQYSNFCNKKVMERMKVTPNQMTNKIISIMVSGHVVVAML